MTKRERQLLNWIEENPLISQKELADKAGITRSSVAVHISNLMKKGYITGKGYIVQTAPYVTVVGGVNVDIGGRPEAALVARDSNPGAVHSSLGGVGRNIAHNMALAVSDMEIYRHLTPQALAQRHKLLDASQVVVIDTNIPAESIAWLAENCAAPLFADPVSTAKAVKLKPVLGKLHTLKPNRLEAELLSGVPITGEASLNKAADALLETGLRRVFISLGAEGVFAADRSGRVQLPCLPAELVNATGCGDAFMAAIAWAYLRGTDLADTARAGLAASSIAMESRETINPAMSEEALESRLINP